MQFRGPRLLIAPVLAHGGLAGMQMGGGTYAEARDWNFRLQANTVNVYQGNTSLLGLGYTYGTGWNNGNVKGHSITTGGGTVNQYFTYDALSRLSVAAENPSNPGAPACPDASSNWCEANQYDAYGNRAVQARSNLNASTLDPPGFDAGTNRIAPNGGSNAWQYDGAGEVVRDGGYATYAWDAEGRITAYCPSQTDPGQCNATALGAYVYSYDGEGRRVKKQSPVAAATVYAYGVDGGMKAEYGGETETWGGTQYLFADALGSTRLVMGTGTERHDYLPFGVELARSGNGYGANTIALKYTSKERDAESGLDYFGARYFSGAQGRFTSPDPLMASGRPENPQTWNRYAYVSNNPLRSIDPTGLEEEKVNSTIQYGCAQGYTGANCDDPVITNPQFYAVAQGVNQAAPVVNALAVATPFVPLVAVGGAALLGLSAPTITAAGTAGVAAAESPQGQQAVAGLLPAAQNGVQWAGQITTSVTQSATTMFRVWGGASEQAGAWLTPNMPASSSAAISSLALPVGNTAQFVSQVAVPAGTLIQSGTAAPLFGQVGGGAQVLLLQYLPLVNFGAGVPFR